EVGEALVVRVEGHRRVAEHRFRPGGGHDDALVAPLHRIGDVVELALHRLHLHFEVGNRRAQGRGPVDHVLAAADEPFAVEAHEGLAHGVGEPGVHGEALARPVAGGPHQIELLADVALVLLLPPPHPLQEALPAELTPAGAFEAKLALHHELGGNAGVIGARQPEGVVALHAAPAGEQVLERRLEGVADVELAGDVGGRDHDAEGGLRRGGLGPEVLLLRPAPLPDLLVGLGLEALVHLRLRLHRLHRLRRFHHFLSIKPSTKEKGAVTAPLPFTFGRAEGRRHSTWASSSRKRSRMITSAMSGMTSQATSRTVLSLSSSTSRRAMRSTSPSERWPLPLPVASVAAAGGAAAAAGNASAGLTAGALQASGSGSGTASQVWGSNSAGGVHDGGAGGAGDASGTWGSSSGAAAQSKPATDGAAGGGGANEGSSGM